MMDDHERDEEHAKDLDKKDPLAGFRKKFHVPEGVLYFDGNSLGLPPEPALEHARKALREWRDLGIEGWTESDPPWFWYGERLGDEIAPLLGAHEDEVVVANSTTVNIHQLFATFYEPTQGRSKVVVDALDFPTDHYAIRSQLMLHGLDPEKHLSVVESRDGRTIEEEDIIEAIDDEVALVFLPSVLYRSGQLFDLRKITQVAHEHGALAGFDIAHSVGVFPHDLSEVGVDFAVWCGYKYLNGGPGATAGLYVNRRHFGTDPGLAGWWGHEKETQFDMNLTFTPAPNAGAWQIGTVPVLSSAPLFGSLKVINEAGIERVRDKSIQLTEYLISLVDNALSEYGYAVGTPREPEKRGGHIALIHPEAYRISQALRDRGVIVDYRPPDVIRICPSPLYTRFRDVRDVVDHLEEIADEGVYERFDTEKSSVT